LTNSYRISYSSLEVIVILSASEESMQQILHLKSGSASRYSIFPFFCIRLELADFPSLSVGIV
jgi:hypothetical protein